MIENGLVSIVIPNFNGRDLLRKNLPKVVKASQKKENSILEVIIVDDASNDDSIKILEKEFPEITLVRHKKNRGFASTVNTGVRTSKGRYVCLLNSDVSPSEVFLKSTLTLIEPEDIFAVGLCEEGFAWAKGFFKDGFIEHSVGTFTREPHISFWASGGSALFKRDVWFELGGLDEKIFKFYWEDVDVSYRAQKRGYKVLWDPRAKVVHKHESTTSKVFNSRQKSEMVETNQLLFTWKNLTSERLFKKHTQAILRRIITHPGYIKIVLRALKKLPLIMTARKKEIKETKISDEALFDRFNVN